MTAMTYPATDACTTVDEQFGVKVADPYRWLENDVRTDPKVAAWVAAENRVTDAYLATLPGPRHLQDAVEDADRLRALRRAGEEGWAVFLRAQCGAAEPGSPLRSRRRRWRRSGADRSQYLVEGRREPRWVNGRRARTASASSMRSRTAVRIGGRSRYLTSTAARCSMTRLNGSNSPASPGRRTGRVSIIRASRRHPRGRSSSRSTRIRRSISTRSARRNQPIG